jgi:Mg-chelatase subunit ChlD
MMNSFYFIHPEWLFGLLALALLPFIRYQKFAWPQLISPLSMRFPWLQRLLSAPPNNAAPGANSLHITPFMLMMACFIITLAQPAQQGAALPHADSPQAVDLIILLNTSVSMVLKDSSIDEQQVDRMTKQVDIISKLVKDFRGDRIALVILGRPAALWLPLTADKKLIRSMLARLQTTLGGRNSDISAALQLVGEKFALDEDDNANEKIILLSTDAYQQLGAQPPQQAVGNLARRGYKLYTLAIGSTQFPEEMLGKSHLIYQPVDLALLQQLAVIGGGKMLRASDNDVQQKLLSAMNRSRQKSTARQPRPIINLYFWPLLAAMLILLWQLLEGRLSLPRHARR